MGETFETTSPFVGATPPTVDATSVPLMRNASVPALPEKRNSTPAVVSASAVESASLKIRAERFSPASLSRRTHARIENFSSPSNGS